jgi:hypothetical protein
MRQHPKHKLPRHLIRVYRFVLKGRNYKIVTCDSILSEIRRALRRKFGSSSERLEGALADYLDDLIPVTLPRNLTRICRDPNDELNILPA